MKTLCVLLLVVFPQFSFGERPDVYLDSRKDAILVDGLVEAEWEKHDSQAFELSEIAGRWKGAYDNTYYYFLIEVADTEGLTNNVHLE